STIRGPTIQGPGAATIDLHQCRVGGLRHSGPSRSRLQGFALFGKGAPMFKPQILCAALIVATVTGCDKPAPPTPQARAVRTFTVERHAEGETVSLTGHIRAKDQASLAFRLDGRMIERPVNVSDVLAAGQV